MNLATVEDNPDQEAVSVVERARTDKQDRIAGKVETLADKLLDNANQLLDNPFAGLKEKEFTIKVLDKTVKMVQGNEALRLKRGQQRRENANFLVELLQKARSGQLKKEEIDSIGAGATAEEPSFLPDA